MTTLSDISKLIQVDDKIIIENQEEQTKALESIDKNFERFFKLQERKRLDDLEDRLENKRRARVVGAAAGGGAAAAAGKSSGIGGLPIGLAKGIAGLVAAMLGVNALKEAVNKLFKTVKAQEAAIADQNKADLAKAKKIQQDNIKQLKAEERAAKTRVRQAYTELDKIYDPRTDAKREATEKLKQAKLEAEAAKQARIAAQEQIKEMKDLNKQLNKVQQMKLPKDIAADVNLRASDVVKVVRQIPPQLQLPTVTNAPTLPNTAGVDKAPTLPEAPKQPPTPTADKPYNKLNAFTDADIANAGFKRQFSVSTGRLTYIDPETGKFAKLESVLEKVQATVKGPTKPAAPPPNTTVKAPAVDTRPATPGGGRVLQGVGLATLQPDEILATAAEIVENTSKSTGVKKAAGKVARTLGGLPFQAFAFAITPSMLADASAGAGVFSAYADFVRLIQTGGSKDQINAARVKLTQQVKLYESTFGSISDPTQLGQEGAALKQITQMDATQLSTLTNYLRPSGFDKEQTLMLTPLEFTGGQAAPQILSRRAAMSKYKAAPITSVDTGQSWYRDATSGNVVVVNNNYDNSDNSVTSQSSAGMHLGGTGMNAVDLKYEKKYMYMRGFGQSIGQVF